MSEFTPQQLATARAAAWHQNGEALLTLEALRDWLNGYGLVLFAPRPLQIAAPAPTFVEAVLGAVHPVPTPADIEQARSLLARLVAEGSAIPLNLLGGVTDVPDFVVSSKLFSFMFTLRGDKAWKQPPVTTGTTRVAPLAVNTYQALTEKGESTVAELVHELGREVTEAAVLRALCELWGHLRVLPVPQADGTETKWELATKRFTKQIKAGMNAGLPSALSGLISVYLAQATAATEEEVEVFLSPLIARSKIREVLHALLSARQLETVVLEGKTLLHVEGELPEFAAEPVTEVVVGEVAADGVPAAEGGSAPSSYVPRADSSRIRKFAGARPERERRPFNRDNKFGGAPKRDFTKPWEEEKRSPQPALDAGSTGEPPQFFKRPASAEDRPSFKKRDEGGWKPAARSSSGDQPQYGEAPGKSFEDKPRFERREGGDRPARKPYGDRPSKPYGDRAPRPSGDRPRFGGGGSKFGGSRFGGARPDGPRKSFGDRPRPSGDSEGRPPRRDFSDRPSKPFGDRAPRPFGDRPKFDGPRKSFGGGGGDDRPRRSFGDKPSFGGGGRPPRRDFGDKPFRPRPSGDGEGRPPRRDFNDRPSKPFGDRAPRPFGDRPKFDGPRKSFGGGGGGDRPRRSFGDKPSFGGRPSFGGGAGRPPRRDFGDKPFRPRPSGDGESRPPRRDFGDKPAGGFGPKKFGAKPFGSKPFGDGPRKSFGDKPGGFGGRPSFGGKPGGGFGGKPKFGGKPGGGFGGRPSFGGKPGGGFGGKPKFGGKPGGGFGGKKFGGKPGGAPRPRRESEGGGQG